MPVTLFTHEGLDLPWDVAQFTKSRSDIAKLITVDMVEFLNNNPPTKSADVARRQSWDKFSRQSKLLSTFKTVEYGLSERLFTVVFKHWWGLLKVPDVK